MKKQFFKPIVAIFAACLCFINLSARADETDPPTDEVVIVEYESMFYKVIGEENDGITPVELVNPHDYDGREKYDVPSTSNCILPETFIIDNKTYCLESIGSLALNEVETDYLEIPNSVKHITATALYQLKVNKELKLPDDILIDEFRPSNSVKVNKMTLPLSWKAVPCLGFNWTVEHLTIPDGIETLLSITIDYGDVVIGAGSLNGFYRNVYVGKGLKYVENDALTYATIMKMYMQPTTPPTCDGDIFGWINPADIPHLYVPEESYDAYMKHPQWSKCYVIPRKNLADVESVETNTLSITGGKGCISVAGNPESNVEVFNMNGQIVYTGAASTVDGLTAGIYVVRCGNNTMKVVVR